MSIIAIMKRIMRQFRRDKRSLALMIVAPLFILTLLWLVLDVDDYKSIIAIITAPEVIISAMKEAGVREVEMTHKAAEIALEKQEIDAYIQFDQEKYYIKLEGNDPTANRAVQRALQQAIHAFHPHETQLDFNYLHGSAQLNVYDRIGPALIGLFIFFFIFILGESIS